MFYSILIPLLSDVGEWVVGVPLFIAAVFIVMIICRAIFGDSNR